MCVFLFCFHPDLDWDEGKLRVLFVMDMTLFAVACFQNVLLCLCSSAGYRQILFFVCLLNVSAELGGIEID